MKTSTSSLERQGENLSAPHPLSGAVGETDQTLATGDAWGTKSVALFNQYRRTFRGKEIYRKMYT